MFSLEPDWPLRFLLTARTVTPAERNALALAVGRDELARVARGVYTDAARARSLSPRAAHRDLVYARVLRGGRSDVFSHESAVAMWRLPRVAPWPARPTALAGQLRGGSTTAGLTRRIVEDPVATETIDGIRVTAFAETVAHAATVSNVTDAVVLCDAALHGIRAGGFHRVTRESLAACLPSDGRRGVATARFAVEFASAAADTPGESVSRLSMRRAGLSPPVEQFQLVDGEGVTITDFAWPEFKVVGEFDGLGKYLREELRAGRAPADVVVAEKLREDRIRALGWKVVRWEWPEAMSPGLLEAKLRRAGVR